MVQPVLRKRGFKSIVFGKGREDLLLLDTLRGEVKAEARPSVNHLSWIERSLERVTNYLRIISGMPIFLVSGNTTLSTVSKIAFLKCAVPCKDSRTSRVQKKIATELGRFKLLIFLEAAIGIEPMNKGFAVINSRFLPNAS